MTILDIGYLFSWALLLGGPNWSKGCGCGEDSRGGRAENGELGPDGRELNSGLEGRELNSEFCARKLNSFRELKGCCSKGLELNVDGRVAPGRDGCCRSVK